MITIKYLPLEKFEFSAEDGAVFAKVKEKQLRRSVFYKIQDMAYWDAMVLFNPQTQRAVAVYSQVIGLREATRLIKKALADAIPF